MAMQQAVNLPYGGSIPPFPETCQEFNHSSAGLANQFI